MIILGFGSKARQGKDTAGEAIVEHYSYQASLLKQHGLSYGLKVKLVKFAAALYEECYKLHGMTDKDPILLQTVGMQRRNQDVNYWVNRAFESIPANTDIAVFTDVRFKNEAEMIKQKGGYLIEVIRLNQDGTRYYATDRPSDHPSETDLDNYNFDFNITSKSDVLTGELAVTIAEYVRGLHV
jgi:hypothetical protein